MAMKIPDAPNVIGTQPVLRQVESLNPQFETPNYKIDVSQPAKAIKDAGNAYADYVEYNTNIWMGAACNQFSHDVLAEETRLKDTHKRFAANDLYAKLEKKATEVLDDITGDPKDDGRIRIANPELKKRFRDWASKQMPAYQARMMNYSASELERANKEEIERGIRDSNEFVLGSSYETAPQELEAVWSNYVRAAQLSAQGMPKDYQMAEAARMMDEAVFAKMKVLSDNNIIESLQWYYNIPEIQKSMSSKSKAAFFDNVEKNYIEQGGSRVAENLASGGSGAEAGGYLDKTILHAAFPNKSEEQLGSIYTKVYDKGREINDARIKAQQGMREQQLASVQGKIITEDISDPTVLMQTYQEYHNVDPAAADDWVRSVQKDLSDKYVTDEYNKLFPLGDPLEAGADERAMVETLGKEATEGLLGKTINEERFDLDMHKVDILNRYDKVVSDTSAWVNNPVYTEYIAKAASGEYHGEDVPALRNMPLQLRNNLSQIVYYNGRYNEVTRLNPHLDDDLKARISGYTGKNKDKMALFANNVQREAVKAFDRYRQSGSSFPLRDSIEYNTILNTIVKNAESPSKIRTEQYLNKESADYLQSQKINAYLYPEKAREALEDVDAVPLNLKVAKKIKKEINAESWADAIINSVPRTKRNRIEPYREAIIRGIETTGNADVWYNYIDGIGNQ